MAERSGDWFRQAESDLRHARHARDDQDFDWWYPNGFERGAPVDFYTRAEADRAIAHAEAILEFCRRQIGG